MFLRENEVGRRIATHLERGQTLLDLGGGTGYVSRWLRDRAGVHPTLADVVDYSNREPSLPFIALSAEDPGRVPVADGSFDVVILLFVLHHVERREDQERLLDEAVRVARRRLVIIEDTPRTGLDLVLNKAWDWALNQRHRVPTPFTFRRPEEWIERFKARDLSIAYAETYRAAWPTLFCYPNSLYVLDR